MGSANSTSAPYQVFPSSDGRINIGAANPVNYQRLKTRTPAEWMEQFDAVVHPILYGPLPKR